MKKLLFTFSIFVLLASGCNSSKQASMETEPFVTQATAVVPSPTPVQTPPPTSTQTTNLLATNNSLPQSQNQKHKTYTGFGFTFKYPETWVIGFISYPETQPSNCGGDWGKAVACIYLAPSNQSKEKPTGVSILIFKTLKSPLEWCEILSDNFNCSAGNVNSFTTAIASTKEGHYPKEESTILASQGTLILLGTQDLTNKAVYTSVLNSVQFIK